MKPGRIALFFAAVIAALALICALFPRDGVTVAGHEFYLPPMPPAFDEPADIDLDNDEKPSLSPAVAQLSDSIVCLQNFSDSSDTRFWLPDSLFFDAFWTRAEQARANGQILRILHYGDSQIEMDRITSQLRSYMQETFGGGGPGMLPYRTIIPSLSVSQWAEGGLTHLSTFGDSTVTRSRGNYGPMMQCFRLDGNATVRLRASSHASVDKRLKAFSNIRLVYNNRHGTLKSTLIDRQNQSNDPREVSTIGVGSIVWTLDSASTVLSLTTRGSADLYCVTVDNGPGVAVDNIPMRGCSGQQFTTVDRDLLTQAYAQLNVGMILLQFGGNSVPYLNNAKSISTYCQSMGRQIDYIHRCCPKAKIIFVGPSDMSTRHKGVLQTYPMLPVLIDSLIATANSHNAAYWSIYHVMGGFNSMVHWNKKGLAGSDYIHFSQQGAEIMGGKMAQAFADNYLLFCMRRRMDKINEK